MGCGDAPGAARLPGGDTEHTGSPVDSLLPRDTPAINTSKALWVFGGSSFSFKNPPNTKSLVCPQLGFTVICAHMLQCTVCQDL